ncbi:unnamed protein product, partial [Mesorhabditis spiculigera]
MAITRSRLVGRGSYSKVYSGRRGDGQEVALKVISEKVKSEYVLRFLPREIVIVKQLNHPNVARVYRVYQLEREQSTVLETEFCANGDLLDKIKKNHHLSENEARPVFRQLIEALKYLESQEIVHRDLKCENIFLDANDNVKLGDFGFSRVLKKGEKSDTFCGSKVYVAPEILRARRYEGNAVDIWSSGIVLYIMVTGVMPYDERNMKKMVERQLTHKIRFPTSPEVSNTVRQLLYAILHPEPKSRISYNDMIEHDWLKDTPYRMNKDDDFKALLPTPDAEKMQVPNSIEDAPLI